MAASPGPATPLRGRCRALVVPVAALLLGCLALLAVLVTDGADGPAAAAAAGPESGRARPRGAPPGAPAAGPPGAPASWQPSPQGRLLSSAEQPGGVQVVADEDVGPERAVPLRHAHVPDCGGRFCQGITRLPVRHLLPEAADLQRGLAAFSGCLWMFVVSYFVIAAVSCILMEIVNAVCARKVQYVVMERPPDDASFTVFCILYHALCWVVAALAFWSGSVNTTFGASFELYVAWELFIISAHWWCLVSRLCYRSMRPLRPATISGTVSLSLIPLASEPFDALRDPIMASVYLLYGTIGIGPALLSLLGVVMALARILSDRGALAGQKRSAWPLRAADGGGRDEVAGGGPQCPPRGAPLTMRGRVARFSLGVMVSRTSAFHQVLLVRELCQGAAAVLFAASGLVRWRVTGESHGGYVLPVIVGVIAALRIVITLVLRPYLLAWYSQYGEWSDVSARDVQRAVQVRGIATKSLILACRSVIVNEGESIAAREAALRSLSLFFDQELSSDEISLIREAALSPEVVREEQLMQVHPGLIKSLGMESLVAVAQRLQNCIAQGDAAAIENALNVDLHRTGVFAGNSRLKLVELKDGVKHYSDQNFELRKVPSDLEGAMIAVGPMDAAGIDFRVVAAHETVGVMIAHAAKRDCYAGVKEILKQLDTLGFARTVLSEMSTDSFNLKGVDLWQLDVGERRVLTLKADSRLEFTFCLARQRVGAGGAECSLAPLVPHMRALLGHTSPSVRASAAVVCGTWGFDAEGHCLAEVREMIHRDAEVDVRKVAVESLGSRGADATAEDVAVLARALEEDEHTGLREAAAKELASLGRAAAAESVVALCRAQVKDADIRVRNAAATSVRELLSAFAPEGVPALCGLLRGGDGKALRVVAAAELGLLGSALGSGGVAGLCEALGQDQDSSVRQQAADSLGLLGAAAGAEGVTSLCRAVQHDKDSEVRKAAVGGIYSLGIAAAGKDAKAALANSARSDENPGVRQVAAEAIRGLAKTAAADGAAGSADVEDLASPQWHSKAMFDHRGLECLEDLYAIGAKIGQGSYGSVNTAFTRESNVQRAVKTIDKTRLTSKTSDKLRVARLRLFQRELAIMKMLDHPHIVRLYHTFEDARHHFLVMESCEGGELFDYIMEKGRFTEATSAHVLGQVLKGTNYMHKTGVCHRDLKPENFLCLSKCAVESNTIKIIDFGLSNYLQKSVPLTTRAGTPYYVAPEVLRGIHDERCDLWSCGVVMYILLCGEPPFNGNSDAEIMRSTLKGHYLFDSPVWKSVCQDGKDLIGKLLVPWDVRINAEQALEHGWISQKTPKVSSRLSVVSAGTLIANLRMFKAAHELKKVAMNIIAKQMHDTDGNFLRHIFEELDENNDGLLSPAEMKTGLEKAGMKDMPVDFDELVSAADMDGSGAIDYTEFMSAALSKDQYGKDDILWSCFRILDIDGNGKLSRDEVIKGLHERGPRISTSLSSVATDDYFNEADLNHDGEIDFEEFKAMMCGERLDSLTPTRQLSPVPTPDR